MQYGFPTDGQLQYDITYAMVIGMAEYLSQQTLYGFAMISSYHCICRHPPLMILFTNAGNSNR